MSTWDDAFAAVEADLGAVLALLDAYDGHTRQHDAARKRIIQRSKGRVTPELGSDDAARPGQWGLTLRLDGELEDAGLEVSTWFAAPFGGPPGVVRVALYLSEELPEGGPRHAEALQVAASACGLDLPHPVPTDVLQCGPRSPLGFVDLDATSDDLDLRLADAVLAMLDPARRAARAVLDCWTWTPMSWLLRCGRQLQRDASLEGYGKVSSGAWGGGQYVQVAPPGRSGIFFTAVEPGRLLAHWNPKAEQDSAESAALRGALGGADDVRRGYHGVVLLDLDVARRAASERDHAVVVDAIERALRIYVGRSAP